MIGDPPYPGFRSHYAGMKPKDLSFYKRFFDFHVALREADFQFTLPDMPLLRDYIAEYEWNVRRLVNKYTILSTSGEDREETDELVVDNFGLRKGHESQHKIKEFC